jgi:hypothetical protein
VLKDPQKDADMPSQKLAGSLPPQASQSARRGLMVAAKQPSATRQSCSLAAGWASSNRLQTNIQRLRSLSRTALVGWKFPRLASTHGLVTTLNGMKAPKKAGGDPKIATHFLDMNIPERFPCGATSAFEIEQAASRYFDRRHPGRAAEPKRQKIQETDFAVVCRYAWQSP